MTQDAMCERVRQQLMAAFDGEPSQATGADPRKHLEVCQSCAAWARQLASLEPRFEGFSYPEARQDLWHIVEARIQRPETNPSIGRLAVVAGVLLCWRALQLLIDLPFPVLHPLVPLAAMVVVLWRIARKPLSIVTFAPELQKRGL